MFKNKSLLITGGTGSFGKAVLDKFITKGFGEIKIFSRDEKKQNDLRNKYDKHNIKFIIGDIRDYSSLYSTIKGSDYIFHAAALKQVPSCEFYPEEAIKTNVLGAENLLRAALELKTKKIVMLSTDKAVYPINAMGLTKALMEKIMISNSRLIDNKSQIFCATRYGNVMASRGSVIPLFISQIKQGKSITITDPKMTRFLMSLEESIELVLHAFKEAKQGDIFVKKSSATSVLTLAKALQEIFNAKNDIRIIGTRHGEKKYETLMTSEEKNRSTETSKYFQIRSDARDLNYEKYFSKGEKKTTLLKDYNSNNTKQLDLNETKKLLLKLKYIKEIK
jgi:UDP-glucose 4-epimerase